MKNSLLFTVLFLPAFACFANEVNIVKATATKTGDSTYRFNVTLKHDDTGWQHYANKWEVLTESGKVLASRTLHHPHVNEQPFTRSLTGVFIPTDIQTVKIRAYDSTHGSGEKYFTLKLPKQ